MAAAAAAAVVRGMCVWLEGCFFLGRGGGLWPSWTNKRIFLDMCVRACVKPSGVEACLVSPALLLGSTPSRTAGFLGTSSPGPMADLYAAANQDSGVSSYISAASPAPSTGFGHSLGVGHTAPTSNPPPTIKHMQECTSASTKLMKVYSLFMCPQGPLIATAFTNGYH